MFSDLYRKAAELSSQGQSFAIATVVRVDGSSSARRGSKAIIDPLGKVLLGWVGGGCAENAVRSEALKSIETEKPRMITVDMTDEQLGVSPGCTANAAHREVRRDRSGDPFFQLEVVTQTELHAPGQVLRRAVSAEISSGKLITERSRIVVETHAVGNVKDFPGEFKGAILCKSPGLCKPRIDAKDSVAAKVIALSVFSWIRQTDRAAGA